MAQDVERAELVRPGRSSDWTERAQLKAPRHA